MIGAGVFAAFGPAARGGRQRPADRAARSPPRSRTAMPPRPRSSPPQYPTSGGTYVYGRERLGEWWGFLAGWGFVVGKTASCAAMALTFAAYAVPGPVGATPRRRRGRARADRGRTTAASRRTAALARVLVAALVAAPCSSSSSRSPSAATPHAGTARRRSVARRRRHPRASCRRPACCSSRSPATRASRRSGEEVRDPARTIPRAIPLALGDRRRALPGRRACALAAAGPARSGREHDAARGRRRCGRRRLGRRRRPCRRRGRRASAPCWR